MIVLTHPMHAVFVSYYHPQDRMAAAARLQRTVAYLQGAGWKIEVISPPLGPEKAKTGNALTRLLAKLRTALRLSFRAIFTQADVYFISSPPFSMMIPAILLMLFRRKTAIVFEERDLLSINPLLTFRIVRASGWMKALEHWLLRKVDGAVVASSGAQAELEQYWSDLRSRTHPIQVVSNGFFKEDYGFLKTLPAPERKGPLRIIHIGNLYGSRSPIPLLEALEELRKKRPELDLSHSLRFVFMGKFQSVEDRENFQARVDRSGLGELFVLRDLAPRSEALREVLEADIAFLITHRTGSEWAVPAKLYEYIALGRPILALSSDRAVIEPIQRHQLGWAVGHDQISKLQQLLLWMIDHPKEIRERKLPGMSLTEFDAEAQLQKLDQLLRAVCRK